MLLSFLLFGFEVLGIVATVGTTGAWYGVDQLAQSTASCMAQQGGYSTGCAAIVGNWESKSRTAVLVTTPDGPGAAPVAYGSLVTVTVRRGVNWSLVTLQVSSTATAVSTYLPGSGPVVTYVSP